MRKSRLMAAAGATSLVTLLAACGSGAGASGGDEIKILQFAPYQSQTASLPFMKTAAQAAVDEVNAAGGVNGKKLVLETCDEKYDANVALACAQKAAQDHVAAVVGSLTAFSAQTIPVLQQAHIPSIGPDALTPQDTQSKVNYLFDLGVPSYVAMPAVAKKYLNATKIAVIQLDFANAKPTEDYIRAGAALSDSKIVYSVQVPEDTVDMSQYVSQAEKAGAQVIMSGMDASWLTKLWKAIQASGSNLKVVDTAGSITSQAVAEAGTLAEGTYLVSSTPNPDASNPWGKQYIAAMKKYEPQEKVYAGVGLRAYAAVHLFAETAAGINGDVTSSKVTEALDKVHDKQFMWVNKLSFDEPGPIKQYPRVASTVAFPLVVRGGQIASLPSFDPFAH